MSDDDRVELLIVGGGPAGLSVADAYREHDGPGRVGIVTDEHRMPYRRPPLTKQLLRGEASESDLPMEPESWLGEHDVGLIPGRAVALDPGARKVTLSGGRELSYGRCVLATGAEPKRLIVPGSDDPAVRTMRTLDDLRELRARLADGDPVVVIGSGFIGCEIAASLRMRGHPVTLVSDEPAPNAARIGSQPAARVAGWLQELGVELRLGAGVERIERRDERLTVVAGPQRAEGALAVMAVGIAPRGELAAAAGLSLQDGAVEVDAAMRTDDGSVLAAGDVCRAFNAAAGRSLRVEHWGDALGQGQVAGATAAGADAAWSDVPGFWSTIGEHTLQYWAWGDGYDELRFAPRRDGAFTAWYGREGRLVGVLTHDADEDYERAAGLIAAGAALEER